MTFEEWKDVAKTLNAIYEDKGGLMFETKEKILAWYTVLQDLDYQTLCKAVRNHVINNKFRPSIPELRPRRDSRERCVRGFARDYTGGCG